MTLYRVTARLSIERGDVEHTARLEATVDVTEARVSGPPEDCYPADSEVTRESVTVEPPAELSDEEYEELWQSATWEDA